jgi:hypothetical protein
LVVKTMVRSEYFGVGTSLAQNVFHKTMRTLTTLLLLGSIGCGVDVEATEATLEKQIRWTQQPGEIQDCHVFKLDNARGIEVNRLEVLFPEGSHHVHIYRAEESAPDAVYDCFNGIDWTKWSLVLGAQTKSMDWQLPQGVTIPFSAHQQLLVQVHWLNTTEQPVAEKIDIKFHTTEESEEHLGVLFGVNQRIDLAPGSRSRVEATCQLPEGAKLHAMMGHFHSHGEGYRVTETAGNKELYFSPDEPQFEFKLWSPAYEVQKGAGLKYECGFFNYSGTRLTWGSDTQTQEHCNMTAYYSPAVDTRSLCLLEPSKLSKLTPSKETVATGQDVTFEITLSAAEKTDVKVALQSSDVSAFEVPAEITIPAGATLVTFNGRARRPATVEVSASLNSARVITPVRVTGLVLSEVFYNPATGVANNLQWVEIANLADVPLDLSTYSIGAGTTDFMNTNLPLPMTIPAHGCIVVGGTHSTPANYSPSFALAADFEPDLGNGIAQAAGIGLFSTAGMSATARPVDAVVYGGSNTTLRGPDGQLAPVWPGSAAGGSLKRMTDNVWAKSNAPSPGVCEILYAH